MAHLSLIALVTLGLFAAPVRAQAADARASDAVQFFKAFCVGPTGMRERALAVLGNGNPMANRLSDEAVRAYQGGRAGGVGWAVRSPRDAKLMLDFEERGICGVRILEADEKSVREAFDQMVRGAASAEGVEPTPKPSETETVSGVQTTFIAYELPIGGRTAVVALTTAERPVGEQQHFMTFGFLK